MGDLTDVFALQVSLTPTSIQASLGLHQCLLALKDLEVGFEIDLDLGDVGVFLLIGLGFLETVAGVLTGL